MDDVQALLGQYDLSWLNGGILLFVDNAGQQLVVEADPMMKGTDPQYGLSNFCPSATADVGKVKIKRYQRGRSFLQNHAEMQAGLLRVGNGHDA